MVLKTAVVGIQMKVGFYLDLLISHEPMNVFGFLSAFHLKIFT